MRKFVLATLVLCGAAAATDMPAATAGLAGSWELIGAYREHRDGSRSNDYGAKPRGMLNVASDGRYALQIYHAERPPFEGDFRAAGAQEYKRLLLAMSAHFGSISVEQDKLVFRITAASNPQWDGSVQRRGYQLRGDVLEWRVPPRPDGDVPISVWRRLP
ncbi:MULTISPECIES: lipocalin-like domain-containing protein [unclassified Duganella]|uniref:lipocalin-like domain-containing protein n=1 Tax=unclassified Duganella TaxID=2636909 RepID=UPI0009E70A3F|nr:MULTISPECIES: lipocalin-like domain-containing protein [unclassified Duganella]